MPRDTCTAPATLPLFSTSGASRTSTTSVLALLIISCACAGVMRGTAALATSIICFTLVVMTFLPSIIMPALLPKTDIRHHEWQSTRARSGHLRRLFDHLVGALQKR